MHVRVVSTPGRGENNPYVDLFYDALLAHDVNLVGKLIFELKWLQENIDAFDWIHFHWPELLWRNYRPPFLKKLRQSDFPGSWRFAKYLENNLVKILDKEKKRCFERNLCYLKKNEKKILYTWHNVEPHEEVSGLDWSGNQLLAEQADLIIFHSEWAAQQCRKIHNIHANTVIMHHGNYDGIYPVPRNRSLVARELDFDPGKPIVGCLGAIRDYKGVDVACEALSRLGGAVQFLCAGVPHETFDLNSFKQEISKIPRAVLVPRMITNQEFSDYANLCDFLLFPYKTVTGSGALLASLTLGRGAVASDLPFFREILGETPNAGLLVKPNDAEALAAAIESYLKAQPDVRFNAARSLAAKYSWEQVVMPVVDFFHYR